MEFLVYFTGGSIAIIVMILKFEKKQITKVNTVLKESRSVPPLFLLKSTEQKINTIKSALRYDSAPINMAHASTMANIYNNQRENVRQTKMLEFKRLSAKYNNGSMSLEAYNVQLDELLEQIYNSSELVLAS